MLGYTVSFLSVCDGLCLFASSFSVSSPGSVHSPMTLVSLFVGLLIVFFEEHLLYPSTLSRLITLMANRNSLLPEVAVLSRYLETVFHP